MGHWRTGDRTVSWEVDEGYTTLIGDAHAPTPRGLLHRVHRRDRGGLTAGLRGLLSGEAPRADTCVRFRDAANIWRRFDFSARRLGGPGPCHLQFAVVDATPRLDAERQLASLRRTTASLASHLVLAEERERRRVAEDLHDDIGQLLAALKIRLASLANNLEQSGGPAQLGEAKELLELLDGAIQRTRSLAFDLSSPVLNRIGLVAGLRTLAKRTAAEHSLDVEVRTHGETWEPDERTRTLLYRSVRELMSNAIKHARAHHIGIELEYRPSRLRIAVEDDGIGFDPRVLGDEPGDRGFGLYSVRSALSHFGGSFELRSGSATGTRVELSVSADDVPEAGR